MARARPPKKRRLRLVQSESNRQPSTARGSVHPALLWFGVLGGPAAFGLARWAELLLVTGPCLHPGRSAPVVGLSPSQQILDAVTILCALVAAAAGIVSWHTWRRTWRHEEEQTSGTVGGVSFWALGGLFLSGVFFILILLTGGLALGLTTCAS